MSGRIADYALLSDCQSAALVDRHGSIDWWCAPRFDSRSCFARLLDDDAGHWSIRPALTFDSHRAYDNGTLVLRTSFRTVDLTDALLLSTGPRASCPAAHAMGRLAAANALSQ